MVFDNRRPLTVATPPLLDTRRPLSTDEPDKVLAFYLDKLPVWKLTKAWGMLPVLDVGDGDWEPFTSSEASCPSVAMGELIEGQFKLLVHSPQPGESPDRRPNDSLACSTMGWSSGSALDHAWMKYE